MMNMDVDDKYAMPADTAFFFFFVPGLPRGKGKPKKRKYILHFLQSVRNGMRMSVTHVYQCVCIRSFLLLLLSSI